MLDTHLENLFTVFEQRFVVKQRVLQAMFDANNLKLINELRSDYMRKMSEIQTQNRNISIENLQIHHIENKNEAVISFSVSRTAADQSFEKYLRYLVDSIEELFSIYKRQFENRSFSWVSTIKEIGLLFLEFVPIVSPILSRLQFFRSGPRRRRLRY